MVPQPAHTMRPIHAFRFTVLLLSVSASQLFADPRPNVLLILADDLGYSDLSCYGSEIQTPNLDRLATGGHRFSSFYTSARCCPSRASLLTGLHPHQTGIGSFATRAPRRDGAPSYTGHLLPTCATLAEMLGDAGYSTWMVGKWHMGHPGPIDRGFDHYYGYKNFLAHSENQWDPSLYTRLPESKEPELQTPDPFYVTDVFTDYTLEFLSQARSTPHSELPTPHSEETAPPFFLYLAHSSPHFPVQAPKASIDKHMDTYRRGWDVLRAERFARQKQLGLVPNKATLPPRAEVPVDRDDIANGVPGQPNPAWDSLPADRREDLARRMATFAAMVEHIDTGVGKIIADLEKHGQLDNTLIAFLSDNGACYEWGPFGFDGPSRKGLTKLHTGAGLAAYGQDGTHSSYGSGWANLGNTPLHMYKHFCHEGGIASPLVVHWPAGLKRAGTWSHEPTHLMDIVPTVLEAAGVDYPAERAGHPITPVEGHSLLAHLRDGADVPERPIAFEHQAARGLRHGDWKLVWGKRQPDEVRWELYNLKDDRSEQTDLAGSEPKTRDRLVAEWESWAKRVGADPFAKATTPPPAPSPQPEPPNVANRDLALTAVVARTGKAAPHGVVFAQGGREHGIALHFIDGHPALDIRVNGKVARLKHPDKPTSKQIRLAAKVAAKELSLTADGKRVTAPSPGLLPVTPKDPLTVGHDSLTAAGDYPDGNALKNATVVEYALKPGRKAPTAAPAEPVLTTWGEEVTADNAWREYPRPAFQRDGWTNLNGHWAFAVTPKDAARPTEWPDKILVPFAVESALSGVRRRVTPDDALWYQRTFTATKKPGHRTLLNFEAVDYHTTLWVNGTEIGTHTGGNLPFSFDITGALKDDGNTLTVRVTDATDTEYQLHGKQVSEPRGIWYTPVSGIWQTVWTETVPDVHIAAAKITPSVSGKVRIEIDTAAPQATVVATLNGNEVARTTGDPRALQLDIPAPRLWSPATPTLYTLTLTAGGDTVRSYIGLRETTVARDNDGHLRFYLNGKPLFHWGTLDQGWWPDGLLTPPSDAAMRSDIEFLKAAGFNTVRKHIKVEPRRYYTHCDQIGILVWQDQVSSGPGGNRFKPTSPKWTRLAPDPPEATWPAEAHQQFMAELETMMDTLHNHPSIVQWVPFNERWGQHNTVRVGEWAVARDPSRQINIASGGNFFPVGHVVDHHQYPHPGFPFDLGSGGRFDPFVKVVGEFGGHGFPVPGHLWSPGANNWGYGGLPKDKDEWVERYKTSLKMLVDLKAQGIAAGIYTQTTDVEGEINGLLTYDRKVHKLPAAQLKAILDESNLLDPQERRQSTSNRKPMVIPDAQVAPVAPVMSRAEIEAGLKSHDRALFIKNDWIRDPYITLGPDDHYYLTGTTINDDDPREESDPYNIGLGDQSAVGTTVRVWKSKDLVDWTYLGTPFTLGRDSAHKQPGNRVWAPEVHWIPELDRWALVHCPKRKANFALSAGPELKGPWTHPMGKNNIPRKHDPSLYKDGDTYWMLSENTNVQPLSNTFTKFTAPPTRIDPSGNRPGPDGEPISRIGHEGATMIKVGGKYVHLGTAWSTDRGRQGSYNLYYSTADKITGPYSPRKFAGRFLGHGTPFQTRDGNWWCTAFFNANVPPLPKEGIQQRDLSETAQTINQRGTTIVPLDVKVLPDGQIHIRAKDPHYAHPGPDESQPFD